jgi:hypothetical protein
LNDFMRLFVRVSHAYSSPRNSLIAGNSLGDGCDQHCVASRQPFESRTSNLAAVTGYAGAARALCKHGAGLFGEMQCALAWHSAFCSLSVLRRTPRQEDIKPNRDMSSFVPVRL